MTWSAYQIKAVRKCVSSSEIVMSLRLTVYGCGLKSHGGISGTSASARHIQYMYVNVHMYVSKHE